MGETLLDAYRTTRYLVCVDGVDWADLRIGRGLPDSLQAAVGDGYWAFITAWNPLSLAREDALNRIAQRALCAALNALPDTRLRPAIGIGADGWSEPSFFVTGPSPAELDALANEHQQIAYVLGHGASPAQLRWLRR